MGTWGIGSFENDDAADWLNELEEAENSRCLQKAFKAVLRNDDRIELPQACAAVAAAEVVAAWNGKPAKDLPQEVLNFLKRVDDPPDPALLEMADATLARLQEDECELREAWEESESVDEWTAAIEELRDRLG